MSIETIAPGAKAAITELHLKRKAKPQKGDPRYGRSAITNGSLTTGRGKWARRWRDLHAEIIAEFGLDEDDHDAKRLATLYVEAEKRDLKSASGEDIDASKYALLTGQIARTRQRLKQLHSSANGSDGRRAASAPPPPEPGTLGELLVKDFEASK